MQHPKVPELSSYGRKGDIFFINGEYYRALGDVHLDSQPPGLDVISDDDEPYWQHMKRGSYFVPKTFGVDEECTEGDLFYDTERERYYQARRSGNVLPEWRINIIDSRSSACQWEYVDDTANWMSLLRPLIGDQRLGDIVIPGCHDAGTWGINEWSILVEQDFLNGLADDLAPETVANWSLTHDDKFHAQLTAGFRNLDMRPSDVDEYEPGVFR